MLRKRSSLSRSASAALAFILASLGFLQHLIEGAQRDESAEIG